MPPPTLSAPGPAHTGRLVLTPTDPHAAPERALLISAIREAGLIDSPLPGRPDAFLVGPELLSLIQFTGCAVAIARDPGPHGAFSHVVVPEVAPEPRLLIGRNTRPPRCTDCRTRLPDWRERLTAWSRQPHTGIACPSCGAIRPPWGWDWKQQGGLGRLFIEVEEVFPGEAVPSSGLLGLLTRAAGVSWHYFYVQD